MNSNEQLSVLNFGELNVTIYGTEQDPLIKCSDLLIHILGYKKCRDACWFKNISEIEKSIYL